MKHKRKLVDKLEHIDSNYGTMGSVLDWEARYKIEAELEQIYYKEEAYWQQRGSEKWLLQGDANSAFFHASANGKRRKTKICSLESEDEVISGMEALKLHVVDFYKKLFGFSGHKGVHLSDSFWSADEQLDSDHKRRLEEPFNEEDVAKSIAGMKSESALGPNGFLVIFYKKCGCT
jgi:hypothetical protein